MVGVVASLEYTDMQKEVVVSYMIFVALEPLDVGFGFISLAAVIGSVLVVAATANITPKHNIPPIPLIVIMSKNFNLWYIKRSETVHIHLIFIFVFFNITDETLINE